MPKWIHACGYAPVIFKLHPAFPCNVEIANQIHAAIEDSVQSAPNSDHIT